MIVGLENILKENDLMKYDYNRELITFLKEGLKIVIDYKLEKSLLEPDKNTQYDDWLNGKDVDYPAQFDKLEQKIQSLDSYFEKGGSVLFRLQENHVLEKIAMQASEMPPPEYKHVEIKRDHIHELETYGEKINHPRELIEQYNIAIVRIDDLLNGIIGDKFRRSAKISPDTLQKVVDDFARILNVWGEYFKSVVAIKEELKEQKSGLNVNNPNMYA
jgi:hypothetical protein